MVVLRFVCRSFDCQSVRWRAILLDPSDYNFLLSLLFLFRFVLINRPCAVIGALRLGQNGTKSRTSAQIKPDSYYLIVV